MEYSTIRSLLYLGTDVMIKNVDPNQLRSLKDIITQVTAQRGKPIYIADDARMPLGVTGACIALADCDLIYLRKTLDPIRKCFVLLHECAHLLLDHLPLQCWGKETPTYTQFSATSHTLAIYPRMYRRTMIQVDTAAHEIEAESLAASLFAGLMYPRIEYTDKEYNALCFLQDRLLSIVIPQQNLTIVHKQCIEVTLGDARDVIISHCQNHELTTSPSQTNSDGYAESDENGACEAAYLFKLIAESQQYTSIGTLQPPNVLEHPRRYYLALARHLATLEQQHLPSYI